MDAQIIGIFIALQSLVLGTVFTIFWRILAANKKDHEDLHSRINSLKEKVDEKTEALKDASHALEVMVLQKIIDAKTENNAQVSGVRVELKAELTESTNAIFAKFDRFETRMMTHEDAATHFARIEENLGKLGSSLDEILSTLPRFDERIKSLEKG